MQAIFHERRKTDRARVIYGGTIAFNQRQSTLECVVHNYSDAGAKIALDSTALLPDRIELLVARKGRAYVANIVWRSETEAGLSFRPAPDENAPVPIDWARRLRDCETEKRALKSRLTQLLSEQ
jgi:hypothetical protein